ncbi:MAG TPA: hypothetical protein VFV05_09440 [Methylomirabilota bacterium]|nr:hypothetical protein [Methylomirabilota bacterium]
MKTNALAIALATLLTATAAHAEQPPRDDTQAPRAQEVQAPRDQQDEIQAPRGQDLHEPRDRPDELQAPRGQQ